MGPLGHLNGKACYVLLAIDNATSIRNDPAKSASLRAKVMECFKSHQADANEGRFDVSFFGNVEVRRTVKELKALEELFDKRFSADELAVEDKWGSLVATIENEFMAKAFPTAVYVLSDMEEAAPTLKEPLFEFYWKNDRYRGTLHIHFCQIGMAKMPYLPDLGKASPQEPIIVTTEALTV